MRDGRVPESGRYRGRAGLPIIQAMESRRERVVLETDKYRITGDLTLPKEGYRSRVSEFLNHGDVQFIPLVNAEVEPLNGDPGFHRSFIAVARAHVLLAHQHGDEGA